MQCEMWPCTAPAEFTIDARETETSIPAGAPVANLCMEHLIEERKRFATYRHAYAADAPELVQSNPNRCVKCGHMGTEHSIAGFERARCRICVTDVYHEFEGGYLETVALE